MAPKTSRSLSLETLAVVGGRRHGEPGTPLNPPLVLASNFRRPTEGIYAREDGTETWAAFEEALGLLERGKAVAFSSGMAAASAALDLVPVGGTVVAPLDAYSGSLKRLREGHASGRWKARIVDLVDTANGVAALEGVDLLWLESPSNPLLQVLDLETLCGAARRKGVVSVVDNTFATPVLQRPLEQGADVVLHSVTKFLGGHSDLLLGALVAAEGEMEERLRHGRTLGGGTPGGLEAFLALRGLRTLPLRVARATETAGSLAERLAAHPAVGRVYYPGLPGDPGHERAAAQMEGFGAVVSFEVWGKAEDADAFCRRLELIEHATSLGGVETSLERRSGNPGEEHLPPTLIRMSTGCEDPEDLWADLAQALEA